MTTPSVDPVEPTPVEAQPAKGGVPARLWIALILGAIILVLLLVFIIQNNQAVYIEYFGFAFEMQLGIAMLLSAIAGVLIAGLIGSVRIFQLGRRERRLRKSLRD